MAEWWYTVYISAFATFFYLDLEKNLFHILLNVVLQTVHIKGYENKYSECNHVGLVYAMCKKGSNHIKF